MSVGLIVLWADGAPATVEPPDQDGVPAADGVLRPVHGPEPEAHESAQRRGPSVKGAAGRLALVRCVEKGLVVVGDRRAEYLELFNNFPSCAHEDRRVPEIGQRQVRKAVVSRHPVHSAPSLSVPSAETRVQDIDSVAGSSVLPTTIDVIKSDTSLYRLQIR